MPKTVSWCARAAVVVCVAFAAAGPAVAGAWGPARSGGLGHQTLRGGSGADYLRGAEGPDAVHGNAGADLLTGDTGPDVVLGGRGSDTLNGAAGNDDLRGGSGNDIVSGGFGADRIHGGAGAVITVNWRYITKSGRFVLVRASDRNVAIFGHNKWAFIERRYLPHTAGSGGLCDNTEDGPPRAEPAGPDDDPGAELLNYNSEPPSTTNPTRPGRSDWSRVCSHRKYNVPDSDAA